MEFQKIFQKKIERKKFVISLGTGLAALVLMKSFVYKMFFTKSSVSSKTKKRNIKIKPNPMAVSRNKLGVKNG